MPVVRVVVRTRARTRTRPGSCFGVCAVLRVELRAFTVRYPSEHQSHVTVAIISALALVMTGRFPRAASDELSMAIGFCLLAATKLPAGVHRFSPWVAIKFPHSWPSNLPTGGWLGVRSSGSPPWRASGTIWALRLGEDRQFRTRALEGHKRARGRPHEHDVGAFGFLPGGVGDRGLTGALPARELSDIVAQLVRLLAAEAAVSDYAGTDVGENFAQALTPVRRAVG